MQLKGILKKQAENANNKEDAKNIIAEAGMPLSDDKLEMVAGGTDVPEFRLIDDSFDEWIKWEPK